MIYEYEKVRATIDTIDIIIRTYSRINRTKVLELLYDLRSMVDEKYYREKQENEERYDS